MKPGFMKFFQKFIKNKRIINKRIIIVGLFLLYGRAKMNFEELKVTRVSLSKIETGFIGSLR